MVAALIPVFGVFLVVIPAIGTLFLSGNVAAAIGFAVWIFLMAVFMENFLRPRLIGRNAKVHPFLLLFSVLGGLVVFGATGILLGPLALSLLITLLEIYPTLESERAAGK
jgi:predicted PurR-regulated permease PerM